MDRRASGIRTVQGACGRQPAVKAGGAGVVEGRVSFLRHELKDIFSVYAPMVSRGEWRDYAIDMLRGRAVFSIFRRASENPLYRIEKRPGEARRKGARHPGQWLLVGMDGRILARGDELRTALAPLRRKAMRPV